MATTTERGTIEVPAIELNSKVSRLFTIIAIAAIVVGLGSALGGLGGMIYTYQSAAVENITTPDDAVFAEVPVRGPLSMWAQSDIITQHQLDRTEGLRYAEMERMVPAQDEAGEPILDEAGEVVMVPNETRLSWIDATALTTVLGMGIMAYALSLFAIVMGLVVAGLGYVVLKLRHSAAVLA
jgi:hypothetical protein